jgi:hypothetical protein
MFRKRSRSRDSTSSQIPEEEIMVDIERKEREFEGEMGDLESMGDIFGPDQTLDTSAYDTTRNHPLGRLLLNALSDTTNLAKRTNTKERISDEIDSYLNSLNNRIRRQKETSDDDHFDEFEGEYGMNPEEDTMDDEFCPNCGTEIGYSPEGASCGCNM